MIEFKSLMHVIYQSIQSAAQAVEQESIEYINNFFERIPNEEYQDEESYQKKINKAKELLNAGDTLAATAILDEADKKLRKTMPIAHERKETLRPIMVAMAFPSQTANGIETVIANVPLITLCPMNISRIKEVKFTTDLEVSTDENNELLIGFPATKNNEKQSDNIRSNTNTHIEVTLTGSETPDGLQKIIEGYEKALRAQIPG